MDTTDTANNHPLIKLLTFYYDQWKGEEETHPLLFQQQHGLAIDVPMDWPCLDAIGVLVLRALDDVANTTVGDHVVVIYSTSQTYRDVYNEIGDYTEVKYFSWHELYVAMDIASADQRELVYLRDLLSRSALTVFIGAPHGFPEVTNQVRRMTSGRLVILRTFEEKEK